MTNMIDGVTPAPEPTDVGTSSRELITEHPQATPDIKPDPVDRPMLPPTRSAADPIPADTIIPDVAR